MADTTEEKAGTRRRHTREETEGDLLEAARRILRREGVLGGITLRQVSREAGVNHGQIYQYFGSRRALLRAAVAELLSGQSRVRKKSHQLPFVERRLKFLEVRIADPRLSSLEAILALDGDEEFQVFPEFDLATSDLARDVDEGKLNSDPIAAQVITNAAVQGYCIFRDAYVADTGVNADDLDARFAKVYRLLLDSLAAG